jgi:hypothetical protein
MASEISTELVGVITGGVVILNQMLALLRMKAGSWLESKNGGGIPRRLDKLHDSFEGLRDDIRIERIEDRYAAKEVVETLTKSHDMLAEWQRAIDNGKFSCKMRDVDLEAIRLCRYPNPNRQGKKDVE